MRMLKEQVCQACGMRRVRGGDEYDYQDPCIANLPGVVAACCGHGTWESYALFENGRVLRGKFDHLEGTKSAPKQRRQAGVSASKPARDSSIKTDDEVPGANSRHGESSGPQQLSKPKTEFDRNAYQREYMRERRAAKKLGLSLEEFRKLEGPTR